MDKKISRRRFLKRTTVAGGTVLLHTSLNDVLADAAPPADTENHPQIPYDELVRLPTFRTRIEPHWLGQESQFWYRNDGPQGAREFVFVDAKQGIRRPAFDHARLATALGKAIGHSYLPQSLPFDTIAFTDAEKAVRFRVENHDWECDLATYTCAEVVGQAPNKSEETVPKKTERLEGLSPDGQWQAFVRDSNLYLRHSATGKEKALTTDGSAERTYGGLYWSPDSRKLAACRIHPVTDASVYLVESSPKEANTRGILHSHAYAQPGDPFPRHEPWIFDPVTGTGIAVTIEPIEFGEEPPELVWRSDSRGFYCEQTDRGHQRFRVYSIAVETGKAQVIVDERSQTFLNTSNRYIFYTKNSEDVLYISEQDGWRHLYRYNARQGGLKNRITQGDWVVRSVERVDEESGQIWFQASGKNPGENPYHKHYYRVNFDGTGLVALTDGDGTHSVQFSPENNYLIDTYSRADLPPVHTLRRTADGRLICALEKADITTLTTAGWRSPEIFTAKGRDGKTDIWGLVFRPRNFDPKKQYPVIENIYAGPHDSFVRQNFSVRDGMQSLAELGFIVVQCDGMGTRNRSKAFHDVCWRNLKDAGLPDRIAWIKALASRYPYMDTNRVGIYGTSAGGQSSTGALLFHPEFYKVAVSSCGCHDNRIDKRWWNEQWMGYPVGPWYADSSNITHAANLRGKLLLLVGELDTNVPPESTLRLTDALMKADKDFDFLVITGSDHTGGGTYGERRRRDFFMRHLLHTEPPDRNVPAPPPVPTLLKARSLSEESLAQPDSGGDTTIQFRNQTQGEVKLYWLPGGGKRVSYGTVAPGANREMHTYSGHYWLVTDKDDKPLALYIGESHPGIAEIK